MGIYEYTKFAGTNI